VTDVKVDQVVQAYLKLREKRSDLKKAYDTEDGDLKTKMERLETWLMQQMQATGATQLGSAHGTAYQQTVMKGNCSDWPSFWQWLADNGRFDMVEKRISVKTIQEHWQETGEMPPGINVNPELRVIIRKS
jgi:hypothetical protein